MLKYLLVIFLSLISISPVYAIGRRRVSSQPTYYPQKTYYYQPQVIVQEKFVIPLRETTYNEVKGLKILEDVYGGTFYEINGKIYGAKGQIVEEIKESVNKDKIIIERIITKQY